MTKVFIHDAADAFITSATVDSFETGRVYAFFGLPGKFVKRIAIAGISQSNPATITAPSHGLDNGDVVTITGVSGMVEINGLRGQISVVDEDHIVVQEDATSFGQYAGGGMVLHESDDAPDGYSPTHSEIISSIVGMQRIDRPQVCAGLSRKGWVSGATYGVGEYATVGNKIYVCTGKGPSTSTSVPTDATFTGAAGADGYRWKLVFEPTADMLAAFGTVDDVIPVAKVYDYQAGDVWKSKFTSKSGEITSITITDRGSGYANPSDIVVKIIGDGEGAAAVVSGVTGGTIDAITLTNGGSGYTWAVVSIYDASDNGAGATARAEIAPLIGYGFDAVADLKPDWLIVNARTGRPDCHDVFPAGIPFRCHGIIIDPVIKRSIRASGKCVTVLHEIQVSGINGQFLAGEMVSGIQSGTTGIVASVNGGSVFVATPSGRFVAGEEIRGPSGAATVKNHKVPETEDVWGVLLYYHLHDPVVRIKEQTETVCVAIKVT